MKDFEKVNTIIFDYDGTLHDSRRIYIPAFKYAYDYLVKSNKAEAREWRDEEITRWLGYSKKDMWNLFMPDLEEEYKSEVSTLIGQNMLDKINDRQAVLYPGALETLDHLKDKYTLIFLSNCSLNYMEAQASHFNLREYFTEMYCTEMFEFEKSKKEIVEILQDEYPADYVIVGDRDQDLEVGELDGIHAIGCSYGFGSEDELKKADHVISDITELENYL